MKVKKFLRNEEFKKTNIGANLKKMKLSKLKD